MKRHLLLLLCLLPTLILAQDFRNAAGIRGGYTSGFEYRYYADEMNAYRFLLGTRNEGVQFHILKEFHEYDKFTFSKQLSFFYGIGIHAGYQRWRVKHEFENRIWYDTRTAFLAGMDGAVGLEYLFNQVPLSIGLEAKPYFDLLGREMFELELFDLAFTFRYHF